MATAKDCHTLTTYYEKKFKEKYHSAAVVNRNDARWKFDAILKGLSVQETKDLLDYWFSVDSPQRHPIVWFFYNYDKLITAKADQDEDATRRANLRHETAERVKKWRDRRAGN
jgi:hypothetical protein